VDRSQGRYYLDTVEIVWDETPVEIGERNKALVYIAAAMIVDMTCEACKPGSVW